MRASSGASPRHGALSMPPKSPAPTTLRGTTSSDVFYSPASALGTSSSRSMATSSRPLPTSSRSSLATSSRPLETSSRPMGVGGYVNTSDQTPASVLQAVKNVQTRIEETERAYHRQTLEREDLEQQLRLEREERQRLQQLVYTEQEERRALSNTVTKLQATIEESVASTAAAHRQMSAVTPELERLENEVRLCARVEETQGWLGELERRMQQRVTQTAATLDEYHRDFTDASTSLASALKSKQTMLTEFSDVQTKLQSTVHDLSLQLAAHRTDTTGSLRGVTDTHNAVRQHLDERCDRLNGRADALVATVTDLNAALREQLRSDVDAVKTTVAESSTAQAARVQAVEDEFDSRLGNLRQTIEEKLVAVQKDVGDGFEKAEKRREESIASERTAWTAEIDAMRGTITSSTKALGDELAASIDTFQNRCSAVERDIGSSSAEVSSAVATFTASIAAEQEERRAALTKLQGATEASAAALETSTARRLDESAAEIDSACARMNAEIAQTAEDVLAIRTVMDAKIEQECETLEASLQRVNRTFSEQLSSFQEDINGQVLVRLDDFDGKLAGMVDRLVPCENKLLEVALRAEVKSQSMLIDMRVAEVENAVPQLADSLGEIEDAWGGRLDRFEAELTDMSTDLTMLEAAVSSDR